MIQILSWPDLPIPLLSTLLGGVFVLLGSALFNWNQRRIERKRLRRVLRVEIEDYKQTLKYFIDAKKLLHDIDEKQSMSGQVSDETMEKISSPLYEENRFDIMVLPEEEIRSVAEFYSNLSYLRRLLERNERVVDFYISDIGDRTCRSREEALKFLNRDFFERWRCKQQRRLLPFRKLIYQCRIRYYHWRYD